MLGVSVVNEVETEEFVRKLFCHKKRKSPYVNYQQPASSLALLEALWKQQHQGGRKCDWRQVKTEAGIDW